jgi:hypothetical protein
VSSRFCFAPNAELLSVEEPTLMKDLPIRVDQKARCIFVTVFWGDWHRRMFLHTNLPTMLAPGNLPALADGIGCEYLIYTTAKDAIEVKSDPAFERLQSLLPVTLKLFTPRKAKHPIALHHDVWKQASEYARQRGAFVLLMPPDVAWADGTFARLRTAFEAGKRVMFMAYPRVVSETIVPDMTASFPKGPDQSVIVPPAEMMALAMSHIHPVMAAYNRRSTHFPIHPEMILWPVEGDGFLLRLLARELFCFEPARYPLNTQSLLSRLPPANEIEVFRDSREFLGVSLTPLWKDMEWYLRRSHLDPLFTGRWWVTYESPVNDYISTIDLRFACGRGDETRWRAVEQQARIAMAHLRSAREFVRILLKLKEIGHSRAAAFLASALRVHGLARRWAHRGPFVVLAPSDDAFETAAFDRIPGDGMSAAEARAIIEAHVALRPSKLGPGHAEVRTLAGKAVRVETTDKASPCGDNLVVPIRNVLCRSPAPESARQAAPAETAVMHVPH